ncbi:MAG: hypothetical protein ABI867_44260 [Kofleriaceae bacterium]
MLKAVTLVALVACTDPEVPVGPEFAIDVTRIDLGANRCGTEQTRTVTVHNPRDERLELTIATTTTDIAVAPDFLAIEPGGTFAFAVRTTMPAVPGDVIGELLLTPGSGIPFRMPVTYASTGLALAIPAIVDAGELSPGLGFMSVPIRSVGSGTARVTVGSAAPFQRLSQAPIELAGSSFQFASFQISMPAGLVDRFVPITVEGEVCGTPPQQVELVAAGTADALRLDHTRLELGAIGCGAPPVALAVTNASLAPAVLLTDLDDPSGMLAVPTHRRSPCPPASTPS